jgi:hypothetical protein
MIVTALRIVVAFIPVFIDVVVTFCARAAIQLEYIVYSMAANITLVMTIESIAATSTFN